MAADLKVGDTIYRFGVNRREYRPVTAEEKAAGKIWSSGGPIWREHFVPCLITGETPGTWLLDGHKYSKEDSVVNKKTLRARKTAYGQTRFYTEAQRDDEVYLQENTERIATAVRYCKDVALVKAVDVLLTKAKA